MGPVWAVVVAAGSGTRFGARKQFLELGGEQLAARAVAAARTNCDHVVLVVPNDQLDTTSGADLVVPGGPTRSASVRAGINAVSVDAEIIVVHDAARPLASPALFAATVAAIRGGAKAAICAVPVSDTIKVIEARGATNVVANTPDRTTLVAVQTPQAFDAATLRTAHVGEPEATDDAALVEALGIDVVVVAGEATNFKITTTIDLAFAAGIVEQP